MARNQLHIRNEILFQTAQSILDVCKKNKIELRLFGSIALLFLDTSKREWLYENRPLFGDIDFVVLEKDIEKLESILKELNFENNWNIKMLHGNQRRSFYSPQNISIDFFIDNIVLCQTVELKDRFDTFYPTLSPTDLFLAKIQRINLSSKDIFDIDYLLDFSIENDYISQLSSNDWNWWQALNINLPILLKSKMKQNSKEKIIQLLSDIEKSEKTIKWKIRNLAGKTIKWYNDVQE